MTEADGITFCVATNDPDVLATNFSRSPCFAIANDYQILLRSGFTSAGKAYNGAIDESSNDLIVFAHQDVHFPLGWIGQLRGAIAQLETSDPQWGVLGCWGITKDGEYRGYICSSTHGIHGRPFSEPAPVQTLDELVLILKKSSGLRFDENLPHFHLYGADICLTAAQRHLNSYAISAPCVHNTKQGAILPDEYYRCSTYIRRKWRSSLPIQTTCAELTRFNFGLYERRLREAWIKYSSAEAGRDPRRSVETMLGELRAAQSDQAQAS
jgi:hypothetical protein